MKLLHCLNSPHIGGIERLVIDLAIAQKKQGIDISVMLDTRNGQYYEHLLAQNIPILDSDIKGGFDMSYITYKKLKQIFNSFHIVHLHSFSPLRSMAAKSSRAKIVYTIHGLSKEVRKENIIKYILRETLKSFLLNKVDYFIANSKYTLTKAKLHYNLKKLPHKAILNGVPITTSRSFRNSRANTEFTVGLVSRFTTRKRVDRLLNAFEAFLGKGGNGRLILVGDGSAITDIKHQITQLNLKNHVKLAGYSKDVDEFYKRFNICVQPSDNEGFGLVAVEAYLHGLPILVFGDSGGLQEVVAPLEPENIISTETELADRLIWFSNNRREIEKNATKRMDYAKDKFSIERMERDYWNVYKTLV